MARRNTREGYKRYENDWSEVHEKFQVASDAMVDSHRSWLESILFMRGQQDVIVENDLTVVDGRAKGDPSIRENLLRPSARTAVTTILPEPYRPESRPMSNTPKGAAIARAQDYILTAVLDATRFHETVHRPSAFDFIGTGRAITKTVWVDDFADTQVSLRRAGSDATLISRPSDLGGFPYSYAVSPFRWIPAPHSTPNNIPWCIEVTTMHRDEIVDKWGASALDGAEKAGGVPLAAIGLPGTLDSDYSGASYMEDMYVVYEYWELPTKRRKKGRYLVTTESKVLEKGDGVYELPYTVVTEIDDSDGFNGTGLIQDGVVLQKALNKVYTQLSVSVNMHMSAPLLFPKDATYIDDLRGGRTIKIGPSDIAPRYMETPEFPSAAMNLIPMLERAIENVTGIHDASMGKAPRNLRSGAGVDAITSNDESKLLSSAEAMRSVFTGTCRRILTLIKDNVPESIMYAVAGDDNAYDIRAFYTGSITSFDVAVAPIPGFMISKEAFVSSSIQLKQLGFHIDDAAVLNAVGLADLSPKDDRMLTIARADCAGILQGGLPAPKQYHDHYLFADVALETLIGDELKEIVQQDQAYGMQIETVLTEYRNAHLSMQAGLEYQATQQAAVFGGGQGGPGQEGATQGQAAADSGGRQNPSLQGADPRTHTPDAGGQRTQTVDPRRTGGSDTY